MKSEKKNNLIMKSEKKNNLIMKSEKKNNLIMKSEKKNNLIMKSEKESNEACHPPPPSPIHRSPKKEWIQVQHQSTI